MTATQQHDETTTYTVGIDLGGTKILAAVVGAEGQILAEAKQKTRPKEGPDAVIERIVYAAQKAADRAGLDWHEMRGVGIGAPGPIDPTTGTVYNPPNLPGWEEVALGPRLSEALGVPVSLENDVNLGTLGEYAQGAGRGTRDMVGIFVGTGVGGGLILDGRLRSGYRHAAGELGHMVLMAGGPVCGCGRRGCLEALASRTAIERDLQLGIEAGRESLIPQLTRGGEKRLTSGVLAKAYRRGDPLVTEVLGRAQWYLGLHTAAVVNLIDPEMVVFGGGMVEALDEEFLAPIRVTARQYFIQRMDADKVKLVAAELGDHAVAIGAAVLVARETAATD